MDDGVDPGDTRIHVTGGPLAVCQRHHGDCSLSALACRETILGIAVPVPRRNVTKKAATA